jgi:phosphoribosylanthranilate isomerase
VRVIQALNWQVDETAEAEAARLKEQMGRIAALGIADRVLIDSKVGAAAGGTGVAYEWARARAVFAAPAGVRLIVAGGLKPENVAEAIRQLAPWGVDVSSGVEASEGRKDPERLARFIEDAR